jgi:Glycosyl transferase 4-like domain
MRITFLAPRLPPAVCGVADHTRLLAQALCREGVEVSFVCREERQSGGPPLPGPWDLWDGGVPSLKHRMEKQRPDWLWVQLSGYGYSRWGAPYLLARSLSMMRRALPALRLAMYAHELYCEPHQLGWKGPILSPWQRHTIGQVLRQSDVVFTSTPQYRERIFNAFGLAHDHVHLLPLGSNIPVCLQSDEQREGVRAELGWSQDERIAVVFGSAAFQERTLDRFAELVRQGFRQDALHRVVAVGGKPGGIPDTLLKAAKRLQSDGPVEVLGHQLDWRIGQILSACDFGLLAYPRHLLRKSTIYVAYAFAGLGVLSLDDVGNKLLCPDELPILEAENWDWSEASSNRVQKIRQSLRSYAEKYCTWESIVSQALSHLQSSDLELKAAVPELTVV